ncbi:hypothetical protein JHV56_08800 [Arthrobacter sp. BHU FT2]|nr:hypothetical protein [Arthrobacter sp. BHU FT2]
MTQDNQHAAPETDPGGYGTPTAEQEMGGQGQQQAQGSQGGAGAETNEPQAGAGEDQVTRDADLPSSAAEIDENNDDSKGSAPTSSEPQQEAGIPDGSGNDLPQEQSPKDDDGEEFNAG